MISISSSDLSNLTPHTSRQAEAFSELESHAQFGCQRLFGFINREVEDIKAGVLLVETWCPPPCSELPVSCFRCHLRTRSLPVTVEEAALPRGGVVGKDLPQPVYQRVLIIKCTPIGGAPQGEVPISGFPQSSSSRSWEHILDMVVPLNITVSPQECACCTRYRAIKRVLRAYARSHVCCSIHSHVISPHTAPRPHCQRPSGRRAEVRT